MLTIDHHVQSALSKFNREMKDLNQGEGQVPCQAGQPSKDGPANATLSSSLSTEEKLSWLSIGIWIPYHHL
jgi:hypothetical protein